VSLTLANIARNPTESIAPWAWRGLRLAWVQFDGTAVTQYELTTGKRYLAYFSWYRPVIRYGSEGALLDLSANSATSLSFGQDDRFCPTDQISVVCRVLVLSEPASNKVVVGKRDLSSTVGNNDWQIARRTKNSYEFNFYNIDNVLFSTGWEGARYIGGQLPRMATFVLTYDGSRLKGYGDGVLFYNIAASGQIRNTVGYEVRPSGGLWPFGPHKLLQIYDRALTDYEVKYLSARPYDFLRCRPVTPYWVLDEVPPGGTTPPSIHDIPQRIPGFRFGTLVKRFGVGVGSRFGEIFKRRF